MEVVRLRDGDSVKLRPCPPWCTADRHFAEGDYADPDDGYHHCGPEISVPTSDRWLGLVDGPQTVVHVILKSWTHPLNADSGPACIEINLGTRGQRTDSSAEVTPDEARAIAAALLDLAATADATPRLI